MKKTIKRTLAVLTALCCSLSCATLAYAADDEWGIIPEGYVFSVPTSGPAFHVGANRSQQTQPGQVSSPREEVESPPVQESITVVVPKPEKEQAPTVSEAPGANDFDYTLEEFAALHLEEVNRIREENGLPSLKTDPVLTEMAQERIEEYRWGHKRADGSAWYTIFGEYDTDLRAAGENWTGGGGTPESIARGFMQTSHRENVLNEKAEYVGIGVTWVDTVVDPRIAVLQLYAK